MSENATMAVRPTKKQRELLDFINEFINKHGYSPSYREIMVGCNYTSVATVALHINSLIKRGHLIKRDRSARSLEVVDAEINPVSTANVIKSADEKWLVKLIDARFNELETAKDFTSREVDSLYVLVGALRVIGLEGAAQSFMPRLAELKEKSEKK